MYCIVVKHIILILIFTCKTFYFTLQAKKMQALKQKDDPRAQNDLDMKLKEVVINKEALESTSAHSARNIPPHDEMATKPEEAYPLDKIIFKGEWDYLLDILSLLQEGAKVKSSAYISFVCNRIYKLQEIKVRILQVLWVGWCEFCL